MWRERSTLSSLLVQANDLNISVDTLVLLSFQITSDSTAQFSMSKCWRWINQWVLICLRVYKEKAWDNYKQQRADDCPAFTLLPPERDNRRWHLQQFFAEEQQLFHQNEN